MSDGATGNSVAARSHGFSPWRLAHSATQEALLAALNRASKLPSFGVTDERAPGGIVIPLFRCEIPVCDEFPTSSEAWQATVDFTRAFRIEFPLPVHGGDKAA